MHPRSHDIPIDLHGDLTVLIVMPSATLRGGAEITLRDLVSHRPKDAIGWVVVFLENGPMAADLSELGVTTYIVPAGRTRQLANTLRAVAAIARIARAERARLILGWMSKAHLYAAPAAALAGIPACWFQHGIPSPPSLFDRIATLLPARAILTCSAAVANRQSCLFPSRPTRVVYPGADLRRFSPHLLPSPAECRRILGIQLGAPVVGIVGRLQRWKGIHILIQAMPAVLRQFPDARCVVVGGEHQYEPEYPPFLRSLIADSGLQNHVLLAGQQKNVPEWMQAMDIIVHASDNEPFGIVIVEAMALGKPIVASCRGGPAEIIQHGMNGLLIPPDDPNALAMSIMKYLDDPQVSQKMGAAAASRAQTYSVEAYVCRVKSVLTALIDPQAPQTAQSPETRCVPLS